MIYKEYRIYIYIHIYIYIYIYIWYVQYIFLYLDMSNYKKNAKIHPKVAKQNFSFFHLIATVQQQKNIYIYNTYIYKNVYHIYILHLYTYLL